MEDQSGAAARTVHCACDGLDGQHTIDQGQGSELHVLHGRPVFLKMTKRALKAHQTEDQVDMVIGKDNGKWLPQHV